MSGPFDALLSQLGNVAKGLVSNLPVVGGVVKAAPALIEAGKAASRAFQSLKQANGGQAPADAEAAHDALFNRVKAHADKTLGRLEGK